MAVLVAGAAVLLILGALAVAAASGVGGDELGETDPGIDEASRFVLPALAPNDLDGGAGEFAIADVADGPVFVYFWASWCAPCEREAPLIQKLWPEYREAGYTFVGVNILDSEDDARAFIERHKLTFPSLYDDEGSVYLDFGVNGVPEGFFLSPGLQVERRFVGELREDEFRSLLARIGEAP